jgi:hypothetical protein
VQPATAQGADAQKIDELWAPIQRTQTRSQVYTWNETAKELKMINVTLGVTDGTFSELISVGSGELKVGDQLVTGVVLPISQLRATTPGNPFAPTQGGRSPGGMTPGGNQGGGRGGGGGGGGGGRGGGN